MDPKTHPNRLSPWIGLLILLGAAANSPASDLATLHLEKHSLTFSDQGMIAWDGTTSEFSGLSALEGLVPEGKLEAKANKGKTVVFRRTLRESQGTNQCEVTDEFAEENGGIRWTVSIQGKGAPMGPEVTSTVRFPVGKSPVYWTTWATPESRPKPGPMPGNWQDPFQFVPMVNRSLVYGGEDHLKNDTFSIPCAVVGEKDSSRGIMIGHGIDDPIVWMKMNIGQDGSVSFRRSRRQIASHSRGTYTLYLQAIAQDWRPALGWFRTKFPRHAGTPLANTWMVAGNAGYSEYEGEINARQLHAMGFRFNWKASYDYVYMGMFLPRTDDVNWQWTNARYHGAESNTLTPTSLSKLESYAQRMRSSGFHVLNYMNPAEVGLKVSASKPPRKAQRDEDLWKDSNDFVYYETGDAILYPKNDNRPRRAWEGGVLLDIGVASYRSHLLDQIKRHLEFIPSGSGVCFDRTDFLRLMNWKRDDHIGFFEGAPSGSLALAWKDYLKEAAPLMHAREKAIFCNPLYRRIDLYENIDGYYDEIGNFTQSLNVCAVMAMDRPYVAWTQNVPSALDAFFQMHLYLGAYLTAPLPFNNHTIKPGEERADRGFQDYGPMFEALRFRKWNTEANSLSVSGARGNLFEIPTGLLITVVHGQGHPLASVQLASNHPVLKQAHLTEVLYPGEKEWKAIELPGLAEGKKVEVPLKRDCAMIRIVRCALYPETTAFTNSLEVGVRAAAPEAKVFFRTRSSRPGDAFGTWSEWKPMASPLTLNTTTCLQSELRDGQGAPIAGTRLDREWAKVPVAPPQISPDQGYVDPESGIKVRIAAPACFEGAEIRYTLDGSEPNLQSPVCDNKNNEITVTKAGVVRAKAFYSGLASTSASVRYENPPPMPALPPQPDVFLSDLGTLRETLGVPGTTVQRNLAWGKKPLTLNGTVFAKGLGTCANSDIVFEAKPNYRRFVAVVGVDDAMKNYPKASVKFRIYVTVGEQNQAVDAIATTEKLLFETPVLHARQAVAIDLPIPEGTRVIRLNLNDAGDGIDCDHGNWANAGFILEKSGKSKLSEKSEN